MPYIRQWCNKLTFGRGDLDRRDSGDIVEGPEKRRFSTLSAEVDCRQNRITSGKRRSKENIVLGLSSSNSRARSEQKRSGFPPRSRPHLSFISRIPAKSSVSSLPTGEKAVKEKDRAHFSSAQKSRPWHGPPKNTNRAIWEAFLLENYQQSCTHFVVTCYHCKT